MNRIPSTTESLNNTRQVTTIDTISNSRETTTAGTTDSGGTTVTLDVRRRGDRISAVPLWFCRTQIREATVPTLAADLTRSAFLGICHVGVFKNLLP